MIDYTGQVIGLIKVLGINEQASIEESARKERNIRVYDCECIKCHSKTQRTQTKLNSIKKGYKQDPKHRTGCRRCNKEDLTGVRFGRLTVLSLDTEKSDEKRKRIWKCLCDCGNIVSVQDNNLKKQKEPTRSCGCLQQDRASEANLGRGKRGGDSSNPKYKRLYGIWSNMRHRCTDPNSNRFYIYGERGIKICDEWLEWEPFKEWALTHGYQDDLSIDRIDNNGDYEPSNCRWATIKEQCNNRSTNVLVVWNGETHNITEWSEITGVPANVIQRRLRDPKSFYSIGEALTSKTDGRYTRNVKLLTGVEKDK